MDPQTVQTVVASNPLLFAQRRLYTLEEVQIATSDSSLFARLDELVRKETVELDRAHRLATDAGATTERKMISVSSEYLPKPVMEALATARVGQLFVAQSGPGRGWVLAVRAAVHAPLVGEQAIRVATGMAAERQRRAAVTARSQELLSRARIDYSEDVLAQAAAAASALSAAGSGPQNLRSNAERADLPQGRVRVGRGLKAMMTGAGAGAVLAGLLAVSAVFTWVRFGYERFWLPRLWPLRPPESTPRLLSIVFRAIARPASLTFTERASRWLVSIGFLGCVGALAWAFLAASRLVPWWVLALYAALGWVLGILALYRLPVPSLRDATRAWQPATALGTQALVLSLAGSAYWL